MVPLIFYMTGSTVSHSFPVSAPGCIPCDTLRSGALVAPGNKKKWFNAIPQTIYTGNPFRSGDLGVMSPARCLCAMPVKVAPVP